MTERVPARKSRSTRLNTLRARRLAAVVMAVAVLVPFGASAHVIDPCAGTDHCNYWEEPPTGHCLRAEKAEISDGNGSGYIKSLVRTRAQGSELGVSAACSPAWWVIGGKLKYDLTLWKRVFNNHDNEWDDSICYDSGWVANKDPAWSMQETHKYSVAPCEHGYYFVGLLASVWVDWINNGKGAWVGDQWTVDTNYHYFY